MSNAVYPKAKQAMLAALVAMGTVKVQLVDGANYTYSATHQYFSSIPVNARVGASAPLLNVSVLDGVFDGDDWTAPALSSAPSIEIAVIYVDTGNEATSPVLFYMDTATGMPISAGATGGTIVWSNGSSKIFAI